MPAAVPDGAAMMPADSAPRQISAGSRVRLHLSITLEDGTEVLSSFDGEPLALRIGDGTLAPGIEETLLGLGPGPEQQILADGSAVFGAPDPDNVHLIPCDDLPAGFAPEPGQVIAFAAPGGQEIPGTVVEVEPAGVRVDFNHPLSHRGLRLRVQVLDVD
jgi:FKBP-type peptidyl-prolyl cis-trans isomerase SlpA